MLETKTYREVAAITGFSKSTLYRIKNQIEKRKQGYRWMSC